MAMVMIMAIVNITKITTMVFAVKSTIVNISAIIMGEVIALAMYMATVVAL